MWKKLGKVTQILYISAYEKSIDLVIKPLKSSWICPFNLVQFGGCRGVKRTTKSYVSVARAVGEGDGV
jgi:hypothetical protein